MSMFPLLTHQPTQRIASPNGSPAASERFADRDLRHIVLLRQLEKGLRHVDARGRNHFRSKLPRQGQVTRQARLFLL